jgi:hypothetical protein
MSALIYLGVELGGAITKLPVQFTAERSAASQ